MASRNKGTVPETDAERALAEIARQRFADYQQRWMPVIQESSRRLTEMAQPDSFVRRQAQAMFGGETASAFDAASRKAEQSEWAHGINPASGRAKMRIAGMAADRAAATGIGWSRANQIIEDAYLRGLSALSSAGRGQSSAATDAMSSAASIAQRSAASEAAESASRRAGMYRLAGTGIGMAGAELMSNRPEKPGPSNVFEWGYPE